MSVDNDALRRIRPDMRRRIAAAVDALVALLDQIDGDTDLEEDDPPEDDDPAEDAGDAEPSLGAIPAYDQTLWGSGQGIIASSRKSTTNTAAMTSRHSARR